LRLYGEEDFLSKLKVFNDKTTNLISLDILFNLSKNEFFTKHVEYSMDSFYSCLNYLVGKYKNSDWSEWNKLNITIENLSEDENQKNSMLYLQIIGKLN
jgi:hypothetical protein